MISVANRLGRQQHLLVEPDALTAAIRQFCWWHEPVAKWRDGNDVVVQSLI